MNLTILPNFVTVKNNKNNIYNNNNLKTPNNIIRPSNLSGLTADTVSFGANFAKVSDFLEEQFIQETPRLKGIANVYLDVLNAVADELKHMGFSFNRDYSASNSVKSPKSRTSKIMRSGSIRIPDTIRATIFCNDPYDLSKLKSLVTAMGERRYVLDSEGMPIERLIKRGYMPTQEEIENLRKFNEHDFSSSAEEEKLRASLNKMMTDLDIRLDKKKIANQLINLPPEWRYCVSEPKKSGYEDIQMRFIRSHDKKKNPVRFELIILFGDKYSVAKHEESKYVYDFLRRFKELHVDSNYSSSNSTQGKIEHYMNLIRQMFTGKVSQKLFLNAKNKDYADIPDEVAIKFDEDDQHLFESYFKGLRNSLASFYDESKKSAYNSPSARRQISKDFKADRDMVEEIYNGLKNTIEHYNYQADLKK